MEEAVFSEPDLSDHMKTQTQKQNTSLEMLVCDFRTEIRLIVSINFQRSTDEKKRYSEPYKKEHLASRFRGQSIRDIDWYNIRHCHYIPPSSGSGYAAVYMSSHAGKIMVESKWSTKLET
jgi:hypothetical protein